MINDKNLHQQAGDNSSLMQAETIHINSGIGYSDAKQIFLDLFEANFLKLKEEAAAIANDRAKEITENFLNKLYTEKPENVQELGQPGMQASLYSAQKSYAISGDKKAQDLLVNLLLERSAMPDRPILQSTVAEAITKVEKISIDELNLLTLNFILFDNHYHFEDWNSFVNYLKIEVANFISIAAFLPQTYARLQHLGCSFLNPEKTISITNLLLKRFPGFFSRGFTKKQFYSNSYKLEKQFPLEPYLIPCHFDNNLFQLNINSETNLKQLELDGILEMFMGVIIMKYSLSEKKLEKILNSLKFDQIDKLAAIMKTPFSRLRLTKVGLALSLTHYQVITKNKIDFTSYIKDKTTNTISKEAWGFAMSLSKHASPYGDLH